MNKRALSIFLLSILVISCFLYVFPLNSLADTFLDNEIAWSLNGTSYSPVVHKVSTLNYSLVYTYNSSTGWSNGTFSNYTSITYQLPSPISSQNNLTVTSSKAVQVHGTSNDDDQSIISFDFNLGFGTTIETLNPTVDDYICFALPFTSTQPISTVTFSWGNIVTGNAYEPTQFFTDERMLFYDPYNKSGIGTSGIINTSLWSAPWSSNHYIGLLYCNIPYTDFLNYNIPVSYIPIFSINFNSIGGFNVYYFEPIFYKVGFNEEITVLNNISDNVQIISDAVQSHVAPPSNYTDFSGVDQAEAQVSSKVNSIKNTLDDWALTSYISTGLSWVGAYTSYYFNEFGFIQAIYGIIVFFAIANVLRHGFFRTQRDYVTTDNYSVKGHNTQGDYEITGSRTTRRE